MPSKLLALPEPKRTCTGAWKPSPTMVMRVPPSLVPALGVTDRIAGCWIVPPSE